MLHCNGIDPFVTLMGSFNWGPISHNDIVSSTANEGLDQQYRALEAATVTLRYSTALCPSMGKTREIFDLHFLPKSGFFQANYCDVTKVEVPNCVLTCNM